MEDAHSLHLSLPPSTTAPSSPDDKSPTQPSGSTLTNYGTVEEEKEESPAFFGVFDGHGGSAVAKFTGTTIHNRLAALESYKAGDYEKALKTLYLKTDEDLRADPNFFNDPSGCTAVSSIITPDGKIIVANSGDSRSVLSYKGEAKPMSYDHKPTNAGESARITAAGGFVEFGRVNGNLALSRAIGDFEFKQNFALDAEHQIVTADPEIISHQMDGEEEFLVLACDGIWDCLSSQQVIDVIRRAIANGDSLTKICEDLMVKCLAPDSELGGIGCDNMTVVIVALLGGRTLEEWSAWVKERVDKKIGYVTPDSVADVFGHSNATPLQAAASGLRQAGMGGFANLQQVLAGSGIKLTASDEDDESDSSGASSEDKMDTSESAQEGKKDLDGDSAMEENITSPDTKAVGSVGAPDVPTHPTLIPKQHSRQPEGDEASGAVKVEGLMDTSENPLK